MDRTSIFLNKFYNAVNPIKKGLGAFFVTRKAKISFLILVWSIVAIQIYVNYQEQARRPKTTVTAFSVVADNIIEEWIKGYGRFGNMDISEELRREMLENLAHKLGITDGYTVTKEQGDDFEKIVLSKEGRQADTTLQIISMLVENDEAEQYISIDISTKEQLADAWSLYQKVKRVYEEIGVDGKVSFEAEAEQQGDYVSSGRETFINDVLKLAKAKRVDAIRENDIYTVYGYTKRVDSYLTLNKKKVNLQIALSYAEQEDKTYIKIGIPIVNSSY